MPSSLPAHSSHFVLIQWTPVIIQFMLIVCLLFTVVVFSSMALAGFNYLYLPLLSLDWLARHYLLPCDISTLACTQPNFLCARMCILLYDVTKP